MTAEICFRNGVSVRFEGDYVITSFSDGAELVADTNEQPGQNALARHIGCSVREMNSQHDLLHSRLADFLGLRCSPALWGAAHGKSSTELAGLEEDAILAIQRFEAAAIREAWK